MPYTGEIRVGAVYQSAMLPSSRRVTRIMHGCVDYVLYEKGRRSVRPSCSLTEDMFRQFTSHEIPPEKIP